MTLTIPLKTSNPLNGSHGHWAARARTRATQRQIAGLAFRSAMGRRALLPCVVTLTRLAPSSGLDDDNLRASFKSVRDGIADALGIDDRNPLVTWAYGQERAKSYGVRIEMAPREMK
jgi:hypothetical protein